MGIFLRFFVQIAARNMAMIRANLEALTAFFERHSDVFEFAPPLAGSICFPRLKVGDVETFVCCSECARVCRLLCVWCAAEP
jgi:hypothetical protein